ncbi:glutamine synthetase family protein [Paraliomyxa miuraensis]|uniref:glutamine synthetase family protein n=1 Tax=Paraliomyxa miuraensis TaxID=376150 RepID=UPI00225226FA|nr:glutamine synthetase [Paraliomyxa miuraensis]MCX4247060.1 glutamine synthetase family protein [Paraliomyxa miuraensis]
MTDTIPRITLPPQNSAQLARMLDDRGIRHHKIGAFDIDGVLRGKYVDRGKLLSAVEQGFGFCDVVLGWDSNDQLYDNTVVSGWHTGYRDAPVKLDPTTARVLPFEPATVLVIGGFTGDYATVCPRGVLRRTLERAAGLGYAVKAALEYEFFVFDETPHSAREKGYRNLRPFTPGMFGYSVIRNTVHHEIYHELLDSMAAMDCAIEGLHTETGPGVLEAAIGVDDAARAADKAALFKTFTKVLFQRRGLMATFMAKWSNQYPGQSGHVHVSLCDANTDVNLFHDAAREHELSELMGHFLAGQVRYMPELLPMVCSTINAYRRLVPGMWAPTHANWAVENRTTAIRAIPGGAKGTRSEYRVGPADANPYLALAAAIGSGLRGIEERLPPPPPVVGNAYENPGEHAATLPGTLREATAKFRESTVARELFGDVFVEHFAATRDWEDRENRKYISDWDLARYFEII